MKTSLGKELKTLGAVYTVRREGLDMNGLFEGVLVSAVTYETENWCIEEREEKQTLCCGIKVSSECVCSDPNG